MIIVSQQLSKVASFLRAKSSDVQAVASVAETVVPALAPVAAIVDDVSTDSPLPTPSANPSPIAPAPVTTVEARITAIEASIAKFEATLPSIESTIEVFEALISDVKSFNALKAITDGELLISDVDGEAPAVKVAISDLVQAAVPI